ncbi:hypothetical protein KW479_22275 [Vibrio fluvialis]|uniref:hypothetical protein n=1 Tax=Vibrio parahaemolyticus TaxID=670 RepID=UPI001C9BD2D3|nr:hypothetical protein [Vibrio fluvialis]
MPHRKEFAKKFIEELSLMTDEERNFVEDTKESHDFDLKTSCSIRRLNNDRGFYMSEKEINEATDIVRDQLNVIVALFALCNSEQSVVNLGDDIARKNIGRVKTKCRWKKLDDHIEKELRKIFRDIDTKFELSTKGEDDRILVRKKVTHASNALASLIKTHGLKGLPWGRIDVRPQDSQDDS